MLVSCLPFGARLVFFERLTVGGMSCTLEGGLRPPSFLICMWFCVVFCVGFLSINWGMSCILGEFGRWGACIVLWKVAFGQLFFNRHVVLLCVPCWFLVYQLGHVLYSLRV